MPTKEQMTVNERRKYLKLMKVRYVAGKRQERSQLLTEMQEVTGLHRKSLTRLMHTANLERKKRQKPRSRHSLGRLASSQLRKSLRNCSSASLKVRSTRVASLSVRSVSGYRIAFCPKSPTSGNRGAPPARR